MKPHISPSQLSTFRTCPRLWAYTTLEGRSQPPAGAQHLGSSFHSASEAANRSKLANRQTMPVDEIEDRFVTAFDAVPPSEIQWDDPREKMRNDGAKITRLFGATAAREVQPVAVELEVIIPTDDVDGMPILCRLDLVAGGAVVVDYKTASKAPSADDAANSPQLPLYAKAHEIAFGHMPNAAVLEHFVRPLSKTPLGQRVVQAVTPTKPQVDVWLEDAKATVSQMQHAEQTGLFPYADPTSWKCSAKWCGFFYECGGGAARRSQVAFIGLPATG